MARMALLLLCGWLALAALAANPPASVLPNGDFENGLTGWAPGGGVTADAAAYEGRGALLMTVPGKGGAGTTSAPAPMEAGRDYLLTQRFRSEGFSRTGGFDGVSASFTLYFYDAAGKQVGSIGGGFPYSAQPKWSHWMRLFTVPAGAVSARYTVNIGVSDTGLPSRLWLDQIRLRPWDGAVKAGGRTWTFNADRYFAQADFRRVADDESSSGFSVIANPRFQQKTGYMVGGLYFGQSGSGLPPGTYRVLFRMRVGELPTEPVPVVSLDANPKSGGGNNARTVMSSEFKQAGVYQEVPLRFIVGPETGYMDFRAFWQAKVTTWADTFTVVEEESYTNEQINAIFK
jgi:hypothetical protein